jgi:hypothetical protein
MSNTLATILVNIDVTAGATAVNYAANSAACPILGFNCIGSSGSGDVKLTPIGATDAIIDPGASGGSGARLRLTTGGAGNITAVEIANPGSGYKPGPISVTLSDPYGSGGIISCTAGAGGTVSAVSVTSAGTGYSGYILFDVNDFIEGVTYEIVPRYIEKTSGAGTLRLMGYKLSYRPYQTF